MRYMTVDGLPEGCAFVARMEGGTVEGWNATRKTWKRDNSIIGMFLGFDTDGREITEEEALAIVAKYSK